MAIATSSASPGLSALRRSVTQLLAANSACSEFTPCVWTASVWASESTTAASAARCRERSADPCHERIVRSVSTARGPGRRNIAAALASCGSASAGRFYFRRNTPNRIRSERMPLRQILLAHCQTAAVVGLCIVRSAQSNFGICGILQQDAGTERLFVTGCRTRGQPPRAVCSPSANCPVRIARAARRLTSRQGSGLSAGAAVTTLTVSAAASPRR